VPRRASITLAIALAACGKGRDAAPAAETAPAGSAGSAGSEGPAGGAGSGGSGAESPDRPACEPLAFAESTPVPEASGAGWMTIDGALRLVVVGDSGNHGAYGIVDPETGATVETGALPLTDETSDDLEGAAVRGDTLYTITSSGWIWAWRREAKGFAAIGAPYPLGPVDLPDTKNNDRAPKGDGMVCNARVVNCGRNYEGLCLAPPERVAGSSPGFFGCAGFAASKADGHLYCVTLEDGRLIVHHDRSIAITRPGALADCAFSEDGTLWAGSNMFDMSRVYRITDWQDPGRAKIERIGPLPIGFPETLAVRGDTVYRMSDMGGSPSLMARFRCKR
jgi:hypothetical protein